jgi:hypothetical protein
MNAETLHEIGDILMETRFDGGFDVINMIYGLYDGYLYDELLPLAKERFSGSIYNRIEKIVNIISKYPKINE